MARPSMHEDLEDYQRQGHLVASIPTDYITRFPTLGVHLLNALIEAELLGLEVDGGQIRLDRTTEELDEALAAAQRNWDNIQGYYDRATETPWFDEEYRRSWVDRHAKENGLPAIQWRQPSEQSA